MSREIGFFILVVFVALAVRGLYLLLRDLEWMGVRFKFLFDLHDLWVGLYWKRCRTYAEDFKAVEPPEDRLELYFGFMTLVLKVTLYRKCEPVPMSPSSLGITKDMDSWP